MAEDREIIVTAKAEAEAEADRLLSEGKPNGKGRRGNGVASFHDSVREPVEVDPFNREIAKALVDVRAILGTQRAIKRKPLFGTDVASLLKQDFAPTPFQVERLITTGGIATTAGEPKAGIKTWILIDGAIAIATGTKMCGEFTAKQGTVAIFFAEDQAQSVRNRVRALLAGRGLTSIEPGRFFLEPRGEFIDVLKEEDLAWIVASVRAIGRIDLLVLDPLRDIHSGEEDKSDSMRDVMRSLRVLGELLGCTVWVSHHTPKVTKDTSKRRPGQNLRGSSGIHGSIDSGIYIEPLDGDDTNVFRARATSQVKSGRSGGVFELELTIVDNEHGEAIRASWIHAKADPKKTASKTQADDDVIFSFVRELAIAGETLSRTKLRDHDSRPIPYKRTEAAIDRLIEGKRLALVRGKVVVPGQERGSASD